MLRIAEADSLEPLYHYQMGFHTPYFFSTDFSAWEKSFSEDVDGQGRHLFKELSVKAAYAEDTLVGFVQYGKTAFGFDDRGEISSDVSYCVIRNLYFDKSRPDAGSLLLEEALNTFAETETVYAFFHYFGMSCFARHGKLFEAHSHIAALLKEKGFETEHENVYYASALTGSEESAVKILPQSMTAADQQYMDFILSGKQVGGCEVHFVSRQVAYLRWIYVNGDLTGKGIGTACMHALRQWLSQKGIARLDTDTALLNLTAQHYYEKNGFIREGITRSFYRR